MVTIYLLVNAGLYALFALWCTLAPATTAQALGLNPMGAAGKLEYLVVYGGLQWSIALWFVLLWLNNGARGLTLNLALALYAPLVLYRLGGWLIYRPSGTLAVAVAVLELGMLLWALWLRFGERLPNAQVAAIQWGW